MINHSHSSIPRITQPALDRRAELDKQWAGLKARGETLLNTKIPAYNTKLWEKGDWCDKELSHQPIDLGLIGLPDGDLVVFQ